MSQRAGVIRRESEGRRYSLTDVACRTRKCGSRRRVQDLLQPHDSLLEMLELRHEAGSDWPFLWLIFPAAIGFDCR